MLHSGLTLHQPQPAAIRGRLCLRVAEVTLALSWDDPQLSPTLTGASRRFQVDDESSDVRVTVEWGEKHLFANGTGEGRLFESGALWQLFDRQGQPHFRFASPAYGPSPYKIATFSPDFSSGRVSLNREILAGLEEINPLEYPLDELILTNLLARGSGVEMHACGLVDANHEGYLFVGQSGAGKTTMGRLWQANEGVRILSDDRIILRKNRRGLWMHGTPWHGEGEMASPIRAPLKHVFFLRHGSANRFRSLSPGEAVARLFACCFPPFHSSSGLQFTLGFLEEVTQATPCRELDFVPEAGIVADIHKEIRASGGV